jgi:KDO2-lipid IV(A) lauroyltransferase
MNRRLKNLIKPLRHPFEALFALLSYCLFYVLKPEVASKFGGWIGRKMIPLSSATKTARMNLEAAFPENTDEEITRIISNVCDNFGRIIGEYAHLHSMNVYKDPRFEIVGAEVIEQLKADNKPAIIYGAHLASWEVAIMALTQNGLNTSQMYRATNNPYIDFLVRYVQRKIGQEVLTKGPGDAKKVLDVLKRGDHLFILVDQKFNNGIPVPFFGREAMTAPAAVRLAMKFKCPLVPAKVERLDGFKFRITFYPPQELVDTGHLSADLYTNLCKMNQNLEEWIRQRPDQWLWIHKRWPNAGSKMNTVKLEKVNSQVAIGGE